MGWLCCSQKGPFKDGPGYVARLTGWPVAMVAGGPVKLGANICCEAIWCALSRVDLDARLQEDQWTGWPITKVAGGSAELGGLQP